MDQQHVVIMCQARMGSTRLPRKVMLPLAGAPLLVRFMERVMRSRLASQVVVATTMDPTDDPLVELCEAHRFNVFRGHATDLLDRHYRCAKEYGADIVVKVPSDCPLIDPSIIDRVIGAYLDGQGAYDFASNLHPASYPDGNDVEVMSTGILERAWTNAVKPHEREHTTPWMWDGNAEVRCLNVLWERGLDLSMSHRWTIDYAEDYMFIKAVYDELFFSNPQFTIDDILHMIEARPEVSAMNRHLAGVNWYRHHLDDLRTITSDQTRTYSPKAS